MARICVFDATETVLDAEGLTRRSERIFGLDASAMVRAAVLQPALVATVTDAYSDFGTICSAALELVA